MTVKEGTPVYGHTHKMAKLCPALTTDYYKHLIHQDKQDNVVQPWDLMMGLDELANSIISLRKAIDKKNGVSQPEDTMEKDLYHHQVD